MDLHEWRRYRSSTFVADVACHYGRVVRVAGAESVGKRLGATFGGEFVAFVYQGVAEAEECFGVDVEPLNARAGDCFDLAGPDASGDCSCANWVSKDDAPALQPRREQRHQLVT